MKICNRILLFLLGLSCLHAQLIYAQVPDKSTKIQLDTKLLSCVEKKVQKNDENGEPLTPYYDVHCSAPYAEDPAELRTYMDRRAEVLCKGHPQHEVGYYVENVGVSLCGDSKFRDVEAYIYCD